MAWVISLVHQSVSVPGIYENKIEFKETEKRNSGKKKRPRIFVGGKNCSSLQL